MVRKQDTIYALSSGQGRAAIAVVRITGPDARRTFSAFAVDDPQPRRARLLKLTDPRDGAPIDVALGFWFAGPNSFTGEDMVELQTHGGRAVVGAVFDVLAGVGFRIADPGEFTRRAFENGKLSLDDAEGIADLIDADTALQRQQAFWLMNGGVGLAVADWRGQLLESISLIEASIDFPDEGEISDTLGEQAGAGLETLIASLKESVLRSHRSEIIREGFLVLLAGRPNSGKSTLLNALVKRDVAITSEIAGTTRDLIEVRVDIEGVPVVIVDTAGLHAATDPVEVQGIKRTLDRARQANLILWLSSAIDSCPPEGLDGVTGEVLEVTSMVDLSPAGASGRGPAFSSLTGQGIPELLSLIGKRAREIAGVHEPGVVLMRRHVDAANDMLAACESAQLALYAGQAELAAADLNEAMRHLGRIGDRIATDDILDLIFGRFCLGK